MADATHAEHVSLGRTTVSDNNGSPIHVATAIDRLPRPQLTL